MGQPFPLDSSWSLGMRRDEARDAMPSGSAWNIQDFIPDHQAPLRKRGGWVNVFAGRGGLSATQFTGLCWAPFSAGSALIALDSTGAVWTGASGTNIGTAYQGSSPPFFYRGKVIFPNSDGTTAIKYTDGAAVSALTGSFTGKYGGVWKDHAVLGGSSANPNRIAFSNAADPTTWDLTLQVWDASFPLAGLGFLQNGILLFQEGQTEYLSGSIPPPGGDLRMTRFLDVGCLDANSIVNYQGSVIWASAQGVYMTNGSKVECLTDLGGMRTYWRETFVNNYSSGVPGIASGPGAKRIVCGIFKNYLHVTLTSTSSTYVDTLVCDLERHVWFRFTNWPARAAAHVTSGSEDLFLAFNSVISSASGVYAGTLSSAVASDANGTDVLPVVESAMHRGFARLHRRWIVSQAKQTWRSLYLDYEITSTGVNSPTMRLSVLDDAPDATNYTDITGGAGQSPDPPTTTTWSRIRVLANHPSNGFAYKLTQQVKSLETKIYGVEAEYAGREASRI